MRDPDEFDAFYKDARARLLLQTYALTGDLPAARVAVRDAFVVAWHHWRKADRDGDPEAWTRPIAWAHAQRRHTARIWHREKGLSPEVRNTLDALGRLSVDQRKMVLLTVLATGDLADFAREVGLPREDAERELQTAMSQLAIHLEQATPVGRQVFAPLAEVVADVRLPRASILRRAGAARRRTHTAVGVVAAVAALVVTGTVVTDAGGVQPSLDRSLTETSAPRERERTPEPPAPPPLTEEALLGAATVDATLPGRDWTETRTHDNTEGDGLVVPCQTERYADPRSTVALVRDFAATPRQRGPARSAVQLAEASGSTTAAHRAYGTTLDWYAGCTDDRTQLLATQRVQGVGDEAILLTLRNWNDPVTTLVAGVARTGQIVTTTVTETAAGTQPQTEPAAALLGRAVTGLCTQPDAGACTTTPRLRPSAPLPVGKVPAMISEVDLPPVTGVVRPWAGTEPRRARMNLAATGCDDSEFVGDGWSSNLTRTFLIPGAGLPAEFGLTETVGALALPQARAFVAEVRRKMETCPDDEFGTEVVQVADRSTRLQDLTVWSVTTEVSEKRSVGFRMAILRTGTSVAQIGFVPTDEARMTDATFVALAERALERLPRLPRPRA
jgi:DNA-directed RNA polymerase specialized sigma24 family protein